LLVGSLYGKDLEGVHGRGVPSVWLSRISVESGAEDPTRRLPPLLPNRTLTMDRGSGGYFGRFPGQDQDLGRRDVSLQGPRQGRVDPSARNCRPDTGTSRPP